jgi:hypothetical protein
VRNPTLHGCWHYEAFDYLNIGPKDTRPPSASHSRPCRIKGKWRIRLFGSSNQTLACCTCLSHRSRYTTALTNRRPQSYSELGEDGPGRARYKNARLCARPPAALATPMAPAGVSGLWPMPPARASAASSCVGCAARLGSMQPSLAPQCPTRRVWQGPGSGALRHPARHAAPVLK